jgi:hypothetical protein
LKLATRFLLLFWLTAPTLAWAVSPYITGYAMRERGLTEVMQAVEARLAAQQFEILGRHQPAGLPNHGTIIVTDKRLREAARQVGGAAIVGAVVRVGVRADGATFYANPDYWQRAFFRRGFEAVQPLVADVQRRLGVALGVGQAFGGNESPLDLANYRYMIGMEGFESNKNLLREFPSFESAVQTIRANLGQGVRDTALAYELVLPAQKLAVFGATLNSRVSGEATWIKKLGPDHIAAMPYEIYVVDRQAGALYGRYRIALGWPALGMGTFMGIRDVPLQIKETLSMVAGRTPDVP